MKLFPLGLALVSAILSTSAHGQNTNLGVVVGRADAPSAEAEKGMREWSQAIRMHISEVGYHVVRSAYPGKQIRFQEIHLQQSPGVPELRQWWNDQEAIYVLGARAVHSGQVLRVDSLVYMGRFKGALPSDVFPMRQQVRASDYDASNRAVEALTLYGLGNQAVSQNRKVVACGLYARARLALQGIDSTSMQMSELPTAIRTSQSIQKCPMAH